MQSETPGPASYSLPSSFPSCHDLHANSINPNRFNLYKRFSKFGIGYSAIKKKYYPEYKTELIGRDSPGPSICRLESDFDIKKHNMKTFSRERRIIKLVENIKNL